MVTLVVRWLCQHAKILREAGVRLSESVDLFGVDPTVGEVARLACDEAARVLEQAAEHLGSYPE